MHLCAHHKFSPNLCRTTRSATSLRQPTLRRWARARLLQRRSSIARCCSARRPRWRHGEHGVKEGGGATSWAAVLPACAVPPRPADHHLCPRPLLPLARADRLPDAAAGPPAATHFDAGTTPRSGPSNRGTTLGTTSTRSSSTPWPRCGCACCVLLCCCLVVLLLHALLPCGALLRAAGGGAAQWCCSGCGGQHHQQLCCLSWSGRARLLP